MNEIKCPKCNQVFKADEAGFADIKKQVRDREFEDELREKMNSFERESKSAVQLAEAAVRDEIANETGLLMCPEGAATAAGYIKALSKNLINENDQVVLFNCASGLKYPMPKITKKIDKNNLSNKDFS